MARREDRHTSWLMRDLVQLYIQHDLFALDRKRHFTDALLVLRTSYEVVD